MAASNEIEIKIGGNAAAFQKAAADVVRSTEEVQSSLAGAASAAQAASSSFKSSFDAIGASKAAMDKIAASIDAAADAAAKAGPKFDSLGGRLPLQDFNEFRKSVDQLKKDVSSGFKFNFPPKPIPSDLPAVLNKTRDGAKSASSAILGLSRVAQDAPFGFVGIVNNLTELPGQFNNLSAAAKESGQSVKSLLVSSLLGPAGLGVALSLVTSALTFATVGFGAWTRGFGGADDAIDKTKKEIDDFIKSIRSMGLIQQEATAGVEGQISQVNALAQVVSDSNRPYEQRKRALEELKDINKAYFGDLKLEDAATGALTKTVDEYTKALINNAIQKSFVNEIADVAKQVAKQDDIIAKSRLKLAQAQKAVRDAENFLPTATRDPETAKQKKREEAGRKEAEALAELRTESEKVTTLLTQEALLRDQLNRAVQEGIKFKDLDTQGGKKEEDALKKRLEALEKIQAATKDATTRVGIQEAIFELQVKIAIRDQAKNGLSKDEVDQAIQGFQKELQKEFDAQAIELEAIPKVRFSDVKRADISTKNIESEIAKATGLDKKIPIPTQFDIDLKFNGEEFAKKAERARNQMTNIIATLANGIQGAIIQGSEVLGAAFGELLSGERFGSVLAKAAEGMLGIIGGILQDVGKQIIITSGLVAALKRALDLLFTPGGEAIGLAVGAALIATGALLKNIKFDVPKLAQGGIATGPTLGIFGEAGREAIIPLDKLPAMMNKISVNNQQPIVLNGNLRIDGTDLSLALERVQSRRSRLG